MVIFRNRRRQSNLQCADSVAIAISVGTRVLFLTDVAGLMDGYII